MCWAEKGSCLLGSDDDRCMYGDICARLCSHDRAVLVPVAVHHVGALERDL